MQAKDTNYMQLEDLRIHHSTERASTQSLGLRVMVSSLLHSDMLPLRRKTCQQHAVPPKAASEVKRLMVLESYHISAIGGVECIKVSLDSQLQFVCQPRGSRCFGQEHCLSHHIHHNTQRKE